jgi:hypothetical protein
MRVKMCGVATISKFGFIWPSCFGEDQNVKSLPAKAMTKGAVK